MVTGHSPVLGIIAGIDTIGVIGDVADAVIVDQYSHERTLTGGAADGLGGGRLQITGRHMGEVQLHIDRVVTSISNRHLTALGVVVVARNVMIMVMAGEESNVHFFCHCIDGSTPLQRVTVVITAVQQGLVGDDQQGLGLIQLACHGLERGNRFSNRSVAAKACIVTIFGGHIRHAQGIDVVIAIVNGVGKAIIAETVNKAAALIDAGSLTVMVGPDIVDRHRGITQRIADIARKHTGLIRIAIPCFIDGESITAAGHAGEGHTGILHGAHNGINGRLLRFLIRSGIFRMQIRKDDSSIDDTGGIDGILNRNTQNRFGNLGLRCLGFRFLRFGGIGLCRLRFRDLRFRLLGIVGRCRLQLSNDVRNLVELHCHCVEGHQAHQHHEAQNETENSLHFLHNFFPP